MMCAKRWNQRSTELALVMFANLEQSSGNNDLHWSVSDAHFRPTSVEEELLAAHSVSAALLVSRRTTGAMRGASVCEMTCPHGYTASLTVDVLA